MAGATLLDARRGRGEHCREQAAESREQTAQSKNSKLTADLKTKNVAKMEARRLKNEAEGRLLGTLGKGITLVWAAWGTPRRRSERRSATKPKVLNSRSPIVSNFGAETEAKMDTKIA